MTGADEDTTTPDAAPGVAPEPGVAGPEAAQTAHRRTEGEEMTRAEDASAAMPPPDRTSPPESPAAAEPGVAATPVLPPAAVEPPSPDVAPVGAESALPGKHRGGFERWPTAPVGITPIVTAPDLDAPVQWAPVEPAVPTRGVAAWALGFAIVALFIAMFVGWGFPIGLVAIVTAIIALRRPLESRAVSVWALVIGVVSLLYSAGWLVFAATRTDVVALLAELYG